MFKANLLVYKKIKANKNQVQNAPDFYLLYDEKNNAIVPGPL